MNSNKKTIGIIGAGQLGGMLRDAAYKLGFDVVLLPDFKDKNKILQLGKVSDFVTFEIESAHIEALEALIKEKIPVNPSPKILKIIKDKFSQKVFLSNKGIPVAPYAIIENIEDVKKQGEIFGYPFLLKARFDAYDGRGNYLVKNKKDIPKAFEKLGGSQLYAEKFIPFVKELAVISARDMFDTIESFEVVETIHKNNICHIVHSPAVVSPKIKLKARKLTQKVSESLGGVGVFAVEMFLLKNGEIFVNEIAPRVHNSGHHTIEAYSASQFEQHIRAVTGMHLAKPKLMAKSAVMINILGNREGKANLKGYEKVKLINGIHVHIYGKMETRKERKMGHITALGNSRRQALKNALQARKHISI